MKREGSCMRSMRCRRIAAGSCDQLAMRALFTEDEAAQLIAQLLDLLGIVGRSESCASSKKAFSFSFWAWMPCSINSTRTRLSLRRRCLEMASYLLRRCHAGGLTLRLTCFAVVMTHIILHHFGAVERKTPLKAIRVLEWGTLRFIGSGRYPGRPPDTVIESVQVTIKCVLRHSAHSIIHVYVYVHT